MWIKWNVSQGFFFQMEEGWGEDHPAKRKLSLVHQDFSLFNVYLWTNQSKMGCCLNFQLKNKDYQSKTILIERHQPSIH